jgi:MoxR-like ATPase
LATVNLEPGDHFNRIYGREPQIRRTFDALMLAERTGWNKRRNTLFDGPPGCGKSETMLSFAKMLGKEGEQWLWFDAPNMTKAGAVELIISAPRVPPILFIEEIEKVEEAALRWLLGVMDIRGEVRRTNYRVGNEAKNVRMFVVASANNVKLLKTVMSGALYSRFQNRIYFPEPDRDIMSQILRREVAEIEGEEAWVEPALKFGYDRWGMRDPRDLINIVSVGGKRLLDNSAQKDHEKTMHPFDKISLFRSMKRRDKTAEKLARIEKELQTAV